MSAALLPHPDVCRLRQRCAGRCLSLSWDLHLQITVERGNAYMLHLTLLEVSKTFPKVLNFLFSTTQQPTEPWRVALIKCSTSFSEVIFNHQLCAVITQTKGKRWFAEEAVAGRSVLYLCTRRGCQHRRVANLAPRLGPQLQHQWCDLTRKILFLIKHILAIGNAALSLERVISFMWSCFLHARKRSYRAAQSGNSL